MLQVHNVENDLRKINIFDTIGTLIGESHLTHGNCVEGIIHLPKTVCELYSVPLIRKGRAVSYTHLDVYKRQD